MLSNWIYGFSNGTERADWVGGRLGRLRPHFHAENQVTLVTSGRRKFSTLSSEFTVVVGQGIFFPAGLVRAASEIEHGCRCTNYYVPSGNNNQVSSGVVVFDAAIAVERSRSLTPDIVSLFEQSSEVFRADSNCEYTLQNSKRLLLDTNISITGLARNLGVSREYFSRSFSKLTGISPQAFRIAGRANTARALLKAGRPPTEAAYESGFSDQSHLNRIFRSTFGISPSKYNRAVSAP